MKLFLHDVCSVCMNDMEIEMGMLCMCFPHKAMHGKVLEVHMI
jgi:hypothetical protein